MLERCVAQARDMDVNVQPMLLDVAGKGVLLIADNTCDVVLAFYTLEHLFPLSAYLAEMFRVLKPGGLLVGAIPCGLMWGTGRFFNHQTVATYILTNTRDCT